MLGLFFVVLAYLSGSIPFGLLVGLGRGVDVRTVGSGNIGATNVGRALGRRAAALVLLLDMLKGFLPLIAARLSLPDGSPWIGAAMLAAVVGHVFPLYLRFRGGKGVATQLGGAAAICPLAFATGLALYLVGYGLARVSAVGSLVGVSGALVVMILSRLPGSILLGAGAATALIIARHAENLRDLARGGKR